MAKPDKRQARGDPKTKCEYSGCAVTFGRNSERRRHVREKHGPLIYCCIPSCEWTTRRMGRLKTHLDNVHRSGASTNRTLPSEFRTTSAQSQSLVPPNYFSIPGPNIGLNFAPTTPLIPIDYAFTPQVPRDVSEFHIALNGEGASPPQHNLTQGSSVALRTKAQAAPYRIFRQCRVRRRKSCKTARASYASPHLTHRGSAMGSTPDFYSDGQVNPTACTQWTSGTFNVEPIASFLDSLSLGYSIN